MKLFYLAIFLAFLLGTCKCQDDQEETSEETTTVENTSGEEEEGENAESPVNQVIDYSTLNLNYTAYPNGGVLVQYTQNGLNYVVGLAEKAIFKLMATFPIPDASQDDFSMKNISIKQFEQLKVLTKFINQTGMEVKVIIPKLELSADYNGKVGWLSSSGTAKVNIKNLVINMLIRIEEGIHKLPAIKIPICEGKIERFRMVFSDKGWGGTLLNSLRGFVESIVTKTMGDITCFAARNATGMIETILMDYESGPAVGPAMPMEVICGGGQQEAERKQYHSGGGSFATLLAELEGLSIDMNTNGSAYFDDDEMVMGLKGDFEHKGKKTGLVPEPVILPHIERMVCIAVKEIVPNSFGIIAQDQKYFMYKEALEVSELPTELRVPLKFACPKCRLTMYASPNDPFKVEFSESGVKATVSAFMQIGGVGLFSLKIKVVEATFELETLVNLKVDKQTIKGDVEMGKIEVKILDYGIGGIFDRPLNALLRKLIPKFIWPMIKKKIDSAINDKGFKLPAMCGLSFEKTEIKYVSGAVVVSTDFRYDLEGFIDRYLAWNQGGANGTKAVAPSSGGSGNSGAGQTAAGQPKTTTPTGIQVQTLRHDDGLI